MDLDLRKKENLHIIFWLIKDFSWLMGFEFLAIGMAFPTLGLSFWINWKSRNVRSDLFHSLAVSCWILGNTIWMLGEFYCDDCSRHFAMPAFILGFCFIAYYYLSLWIKKNQT